MPEKNCTVVRLHEPGTAEYWQSRYMLTANKLYRQIARYDAFTIGFENRARKADTPIEEARCKGLAEQARQCASDMQFMYDKMVLGISPEMEDQIQKGVIDLPIAS